MKKQKTKKKPIAKKKGKAAAKKTAKKTTAKKSAKTKAQKKKKSTPVKAKKKPAKKVIAKKTTKTKASKTKTTAKAKPTKKKLPGYPHYSAKDDIMNTTNKSSKVALEEDIELTTVKDDDWNEEPRLSEVKSKKSKNSSSLTKEDQDALGSDELNLNMEDDAELKDRVWQVDMTGEDLDVPGADLDDDDEMPGGEDEENKNYSVGGDRHEDLDENND